MERRPTLKIIIKSFKEVIKARKWAGIAYPVSRNLQSVVAFLQILVMGKFIDSVAKYLTSYETFKLNEFLKTDILRFFSFILILHFAKALTSKLAKHAKTIVNEYVWLRFGRRTIDKISSLNLEDVENPEFQNLLSRVPQFSVNILIDTYIRTSELGYQLIRFISSAYIILTQMSWWGLIVVFFVLPEALLRHRQNIRLKELRDKYTEKQKYYKYLETQSRLLQNFPELRVDNVFKFFKKSFTRELTDYIEKQNEIRRVRDKNAFVWSWLDGTLTYIMQLALIPIALVKRYSIGTFKYLFDYINTLYNASWNFIYNSLLIKRNCMYVDDYFDLYDYEGFGDIDSGEEKLNPLSIPSIRFENVSFTYPNSSSAALHNISFEIDPSEKVVIIGHDNSGKSTIAKLLCGLYKVTPGDIFIDNISVKNLQRGELKDKIAVVFENYVKYKFSIRKNITVTEPERDFNRRRYEEALKVTGLDEWMRKKDIDDNQILGKLFSGGMDFSTGHWQRLAIARALYRDRAILILDESLTQIDGFSRGPLLERIMKYRPKQTLIYITQEETEKEHFDKAVYIKDGKVEKIENIQSTTENVEEKENSQDSNKIK